MFLFNDKWFCENCFVAGREPQGPCPNCGWRGDATPVYAALPTGTVLHGRYIIGRVLGKGGFGITYLAFDSLESRRVAVKEYLPDTLAQRHTGETAVSVFSGEREQAFLNGAERFYEEAKTVARFNGNPNIISVYEFFKENNTAYFVMEYLEGCDLRTWYEHNGGLSYSDAVRILGCVTDALLIVHSMRILHRDISPDNIFLCDNGAVKLIDFGAAKQVVGAQTQSLSVILKPGYAPYEQYQRHSAQGPWTDIYALGATFYYMLTGRLIDDAMTRRDHATLDLSQIPLELQPILNKMLAVQPAERYQNVLELKHALTAGRIDENTAQYFTLPPPGSGMQSGMGTPISSSAYYDNPPMQPSQPMYSVPQPQAYSPAYGNNTAYMEEDPGEERRARRRKTLLLTFSGIGLALILAIVGILMLGGRNREDDTGLVSVESITLSDTALVLRLGETAVLRASVLPETAVNPSIEWSSDDEKVAVVDSNGVVTAKGAGSCNVTATAGGNVTATCTVAVEDAGDLVLDVTRLELFTGETGQITATYNGSAVTWTTDNEGVATVDETGLVTAGDAEGTAIITASADGFSASCVVTVKLGVESIELSETEVEMTMDDSVTLEVELKPDTAEDVDLTWESSDEEVVTVKRGVVKPVGAGEAVITVTAGGAEATCRVTVIAKISSLRLDASSLRLETGETYTFEVSVKPKEVTDPDLKWSTSNAGVVSVQDGTITAISAGTATVTVTGDEEKAECTVTVTAATVSGQSYTMATPVGSISGTYSGQWGSSKPEGDGTLTVSQDVDTIVGSSYRRGDVLTGTWTNGLLSGTGKIKYANGDAYSGEFSNGLRNGSGTLTMADGTVQSGKWVNDVFMG